MKPAINNTFEDAFNVHALILEILQGAQVDFKNENGVATFRVHETYDMCDTVWANLTQGDALNATLEKKIKDILNVDRKRHEKEITALNMVLLTKKEELKSLQNTMKIITEARETIKPSIWKRIFK